LRTQQLLDCPFDGLLLENAKIRGNIRPGADVTLGFQVHEVTGVSSNSGFWLIIAEPRQPRVHFPYATYFIDR